jgi:uncharacterized protein YggU (UPF0235/DUF167 family)
MTVTIAVRVTPRASRDAIDGADAEGILRVRVRAAPVDGAANAALGRLLADELGIPPNAVELVRGTTARRKVVRLVGVDPATVVARWPGVRPML